MPSWCNFTVWPIRKKILVMLLVAFLPGAAIIICSNLAERGKEIESSQKQALLLSDSLAAQQAQITAETRRMLGILSVLPEVQALDAERCTTLFRRIVADQRHYTNLALDAPDGLMLAGANPFKAGVVNVTERKHFQEALRRLDFSVGEYVVGKTSKRPSVHFAYPVVDSKNNVRAVLTAGFGLDSYGRFLDTVKLPEGATVVIADYRGVRLYRFPESGNYGVGKPVSADMFAKISGKRLSGIIDGKGADNIKRTYAFKQVRLGEGTPPYIYILVGIREDRIAQAANFHLLVSLFILALAALVIMSLAQFIGGVFLTKPVKRLLTATRRIGGGDLGSTTGLPHTPDELGQLAKSFDEMSSRLHAEELERKQAEETLRRSEEKYRLLFENSLDGILITAPDGKIFQANPAACQILGWSGEELRNKGRESILDTSDPRVEAALKEWDERERFTGELTGRRKDGTPFPVELSSTILETMNGEKRAYNIFRDVSMRRRAEEALRESEERYRNISGSISDFVFSCTKPAGGDYEIDWLAGGVERITGYTLQEVMDMRCWKFLVHPEDMPIFSKSVTGVEPGGSDQCELRLIHKDGSIRWIRAASSAAESCGLFAAHRLFGSCEDITRRKKSEDQVRLNEERLKRIVRILQHRSRTAVEFLDYALHEAIELTGSKIGYIYFYKEDRKQFILNTWSDGVMDECSITDPQTIYELDKTGVWGEAVRQRRPIILNDFQADHPLKKGYPAGHARLDRFMTIPVLKNDAVIAVVGLGNKAGEYDETDVLQLTLLMDAVWKTVDIIEGEEEKEKLQSQLLQAQKLESVGRLAGGVAHDYNNVLAVIIGYTEMALERVEPGGALQGDLQEVLKAARRSADITGQLLAFARKQTIAPVVLNLNETVESLLKMLRHLMGEDVELEWIPGGERWQVKMDPSQIDQILANLCVNGRDAIDGVGKMIIETETVTLDEAYCSEHAGFVPGEYVSLAASDDGCGMDKETLENIFEPFFTTKGVDKGTGLGLSTVFGIVKQNNGFINVYSEPGRGTTFRIYLRRHAEEGGRAPREKVESFAAKGAGTILLVEDEPSILAMTRKMLERSGYTVLPAGTPGEAIRIAEEHEGEIHLLMTDVVMPEMNGRELAGSILARHPNIKRLFMSGYTANVIAHHGVLDEGVDFIQKPFSMKDLAAKLRAVLLV